MTYTFKKDSKVIAWQSDYVTVEADSYEEACALVKENALDDFACPNEKRIIYDRTEYDTVEVLHVRDNYNQPTEYIYDNEGELIFDNMQ